MAGLEGRPEEFSRAGGAAVVGVVLRASGLGYMVLDLVGNSGIASLAGAPTGDDSAIAPFFDRHEATIGLMAWVIAIGAVFMAVFGVTVTRCLQDSTTTDVVPSLHVTVETPSGRSRASLTFCLV